MDAAEIGKALDSLSELAGNPSKCAAQIRKLHKKVEAIQDVQQKEQLLDKLHTAACYGLGEDLKVMMEEKGLHEEFGLMLVLAYKTTLPELAQYLYTSGKEAGDRYAVVVECMGQDIEVLGGLKVKGIDVKKPWVKKLCEAAPSLRSLQLLSLTEKNTLCQGASSEEMAMVAQLIRVAKDASKTELPSVPRITDPEEKKAVNENRAAEKEKLKQAEKLMIEAKSMAKTQASENKKELNDKLSAVLNALEVPAEWFKPEVVSPDALTKELDAIILQTRKVVESPTEPYISDILDVITKASGGRALCGIYYSDYASPTPAGQPIMSAPAQVSVFNPGQSIDTRFMRFTAQEAAGQYVATIASSSSNTGVAVKGFYNVFAGEVEGAGGFADEAKSSHEIKSSTSSVSVLQSISITKKEFQINEDDMHLTGPARDLAMTIEKAGDQDEAARSFMTRFGSHVPAGKHKLGGIFYSIAEASSKSNNDTYTFIHGTENRLKTQISGGFLGGAFGVGGSVDEEYTRTSGKTEASQSKKDTTSYSFSVKVIGPLASNPETFKKLLVYNSTWAIISRGPPQGYIPVWHFLAKEGSGFQSAAEVLKRVWQEDEMKRKKKWKHNDRMTKAREELFRIKKGYIDKTHHTGDSYRPTNGTLESEEDRLTEEDAYNKAIEYIMKDPEHHICKIVYWYSLIGRWGYSVQRWKASAETEMTFESVSGGHVLFFSELCFKWAKQVPKRG